jgi:hypothetical protein
MSKKLWRLWSRVDSAALWKNLLSIFVRARNSTFQIRWCLSAINPSKIIFFVCSFRNHWWQNIAEFVMRRFAQGFQSCLTKFQDQNWCRYLLWTYQFLFRNVIYHMGSVEPTPESMKGAPAAFYLAGTLDGSRPGKVTVNCNNLAALWV